MKDFIARLGRAGLTRSERVVSFVGSVAAIILLSIRVTTGT